jgi:hypothetical protein
MSMIHNKLRTTPNRYSAVSLKVTVILLALAAGCWLLPRSAYAHGDAIDSAKANVTGTVADVNNDPIPNATVVMQGPSGNSVRATTTEDGSFALIDVTPGTDYRIVVTADGFAEWSSSVSVDPGQQKSVGEITLQILAVQKAITVSYSSKEVAAQQLKAEEHQRVLGFIPNMFVTYEPDPEPLTAKMKFHLAYKGLTHPTFFAIEAVWAGAQQAGDITDYRQGAEGYGQRFGANLAGGATEIFFGDAVLPSLLHQDPRYFYKGSGTKSSRAWHAIAAPFVCEGDNGKLQPNISQMGGSLIAASLSNTYYPDSNRGTGLVFQNFGTSMGLHVVLGLAQEFILPRFTSRGNK